MKFKQVTANELNDRANFHKKHGKGIGWFQKFKPKTTFQGDPEKEAQIFNHMQGSDVPTSGAAAAPAASAGGEAPAGGMGESLEIDQDKLMDVADRYNTSKPVSGSWDTENEHELNAIMKEFNLSRADARNVMIKDLGFDPKDLNEGLFDSCKGKDTDEIFAVINEFCKANPDASFARIIQDELTNGCLADKKDILLGDGKYALSKDGNGAYEFYDMETGRRIWTGTVRSAAAEIANHIIGKDDSYTEELNEARVSVDNELTAADVKDILIDDIKQACPDLIIEDNGYDIDVYDKNTSKVASFEIGEYEHAQDWNNIVFVTVISKDYAIDTIDFNRLNDDGRFDNDIAANKLKELVTNNLNCKVFEGLDPDRERIFAQIAEINPNAREANYADKSVNQMLAILSKMREKSGQMTKFEFKDEEPFTGVKKDPEDGQLYHYENGVKGELATEEENELSESFALTSYDNQGLDDPDENWEGDFDSIDAALNYCNEHNFKDFDVQDVSNGGKFYYRHGKKEENESLTEADSVEDDAGMEGNPEVKPTEDVEPEHPVDNRQELTDTMLDWNYGQDEIEAAFAFCRDNNIDTDYMDPTDFEYIVMQVNNYSYNPLVTPSQAQWDQEYQAVIDKYTY